MGMLMGCKGLGVAWLGLALAGCSTYRLQGVVVADKVSEARVVSADDPELRAGAGLDEARVQITLDPGSMRPKRLAAVRTDAQGRFSVEIKETGAGFLEYQVRLVSRRAGFQATEATFALPSSKKRVLVSMTPGRDTLRPEEDVLEETWRTGKEWLK